MTRLRLLVLTLVVSCSAYTHCTAQPAMSDDDALAAIRVVPFEAEFRTARAAAESGGVDDQLRLGKLYEQALGVDQNLPEAIVWYRRVAEAGSAPAAFALGKVLRGPSPMVDRYEKLEPWLLRAAEMGLVDAQVAVAWFLRANGGASRQQESNDWMERAARQGHPAAMMQAGMILSESNDPTERARGAQYVSAAGDLDRRLKFWNQYLELAKGAVGATKSTIEITDALHESAMSIDLEQEADVGQHGIHQYAVISALSRLQDVNINPEKVIAVARDHVRKSAEAGDLQAACNLGLLQLALNDHVSAFEWYRSAALRGSARAAYHLGVLYRDGRGVQADASSAAAWFYRSAIQMYPPAQAALGDLLLNGKGVAIDAAAALAWLRPAAAYGNPLAQFDLGLMYDRGFGVEANRERALMLIAKAAVGYDFPSMNTSHVAARKGLPAAQNWLKSAEADPQGAVTVHRAIAQAPRLGGEKSLNSAPIDCLGRANHSFFGE